MAKIDIISGFLGAGKTTLIKKLVADAFQGEKLVIIENEFGEIGIDGGFLKESGIQITEMNSGCICCSLVGDFGNALKDVLEKYSPDRVIIEPSGVGKLSDVIKAVKNIGDDVKINSTATVVDASKCKMYMKNYGEFYNNQIESAGTIILSRTQNVSEEKLAKVLTMIKEKNDEASVITTPWDQIDGKKILDAMEKVNTLEKELLEEHHHHDGLDLFPDFGRQIPFGTGTSILYNYKDYRFRNDTDLTFQLLAHTTDKYLSGELRASAPQPYRYHIYTENEFFSRENGIVYRNGTVLRDTIDPVTGNHIKQETIRVNHARVLYNTDHLTIIDSDQS